MALLGTAVDHAADFPGVDRVSASRPQVLPLPAVVWGTANDMLLDMYIEEGIEGIEPPYYIMGALGPGGGYLEPTIGQIWPRIG